MVNGVGFRIQEQVTTGRRRAPPPEPVRRRVTTEEERQRVIGRERSSLAKKQLSQLNEKIQKRRQSISEIRRELNELIRSGASQETINRQRGIVRNQIDALEIQIGGFQNARRFATGQFTTKSVLNFGSQRGEARLSRIEARKLIKDVKPQQLPGVTRRAEQPFVGGISTPEGEFFVTPSGERVGRVVRGPFSTPFGEGLDVIPIQQVAPPSDTQLTSFGFPSIKLSDIETLGEFQAGQRQTFFEQESLRRLQSFEPDKEFETSAKEFGKQRFGELPRREQSRLVAGSLVIGGAKLGTTLIQFGIPGFGGVIKEDEFLTSVQERPVSTFFFGPEVESFKPIRDRPGDIIQTGVQIAPIVVGAPFAIKTLVTRGPGGLGTIAKGLSPIKTPSFQEFSLRGLGAQPTRTFGLETGVDPITGGKQFQFVSGREFKPLFGKGGATQVQTFEVLQIPRGAKPPRTVIKGGETITEFVDPITGRGTGGVDFFTGGIDISRVGLPVRQRGKVVPGIEGFVGRGRIFRPGTSEFQEFPVGGVGKRVGRRFFGLDIEPIGAGVRRPTITELTLTQRGFRQRDLIRTDIEPTLFVRGRPIGRTDILLRGRGLDIPTDEQGFQFLVSRGRRGPRTDLFQTKIEPGILGLGEVTRRAPTTFRIPKTSIAGTSLVGLPDALDILRQRTSAFAGKGLFERTDLVGSPIGRRPIGGQILVGPRLTEQFKFTTLVGTGIKQADLLDQRTGLRFGGLPAFGQPQALTPIQLQPPRLGQPEDFFIPTETILQTPTTPTTRGPPSIGFFPGPRGFGGGFTPIGFLPTLGGRPGRRRKRKGRRARPTQLLPSFTAIVADVRGTFPEEVSIGGVDLGITPGKIRRLPKRKVKKKTKTKRKKKR